MLTVVGYDDNKSYDFNGNGIIEDCEKGAEIDHILACVPEIVAYLRGMSPVWRDLVEGKKSFIL